MSSKDKEEIRSRGKRKQQGLQREQSEKVKAGGDEHEPEGGGKEDRSLKSSQTTPRQGYVLKPQDSGLTKSHPIQRHRNTGDRVARHPLTWAYDQQM